MDEMMNTAGMETAGQELPDIDLFASVEDTNPVEAEQPIAEASAEPEGTDPAPQTYEVTFNGEKRQLTLEELTTAAQKGLNYDHVKEKADRADANQRAADIIASFAQAAGVTVEEYLAEAAEQISGKEVQALTDRGMDEDLARELLALRKEKAVNTKERQAAQEQQAKVNAWNKLADHVGGWDKMPFRTPEEVPAAMKAELDAGADPLTAYLLYREKENSNQLAAAQAAAKNRQRAPGSVTSTAGGRAEDAFLSALFGS